MSNNYVDYILDLLSPFGSITSRAMFGGHGIYKDKIIVGIIADDELYFKVDATNKGQYAALNSTPFAYTAKDKKINLSYWKVPIEIMEDEEQLSIWLEQSFFISINVKLQI
ncbi:MAG: TfoX/Sxy family protein [Rickettsiaceae bacterium]|nr:TfoX/Sxy family protein [Rickettsiaceae bacterium]